MIETQRLIIRPWTTQDRKPFSIMSADPQVMRYFPATLNEQQSNQLVDKIERFTAEQGFGFWAVEEKNSAQFIGFLGLNRLATDNGILPHPFVEIGWRLRAESWGKGYAPEGASAVFKYAQRQHINDVYAFTARINSPSIRVMEKIGMHNTQHNFDHPKVDEGHVLRPHCLYKKSM